VGDGLAFGFARDDGIASIVFGPSTPPHRVDVFTSGDIGFEDGLIIDTLLYVTAHEAGLFIFDIDNSGNMQLINQADEHPLNATTIAARGNHAYIADGAGGVLVLDITDPLNVSFVSRIATTSGAQDLGFYGDYAAVAVGGLGVDIIDFSNPENPVFVSNITGNGSAFNLTVDDHLAYVARWDNVEIIDISDPQNPILAGWEDTRTRAMGLTARDSIIYVADWFNVEIYRFGEGLQRDIDINFTQIDMGDVMTGNTVDTVFEVFNTGGSTLNITQISTYNDAFDVVPETAIIPPDSQHEFTLSFTAPSEDYISSVVRVFSDDPDEPFKQFSVYANGSPRLRIGDPAPDFTLEDVNGDFYTLSDYLGKVVFLAFFASW
jgi:hypothetical protein